MDFTNAPFLTYGFVGLGLMGGSLAQAIRQQVLFNRQESNSLNSIIDNCKNVHNGKNIHNDKSVQNGKSIQNSMMPAKEIEKNAKMQTEGGKIVACDKGRFTLEQAQSTGVIDKGFLPGQVDEMLKECDVVFICLYPHNSTEFLIEHQNFFKSGSIVTDISGVKTEFVSRLKDFMREDVDVIPGHPMAGSEREGYAHASGGIFAGRNYLFMPQTQTKPQNIDFLKNLARAIGFTRIIETTSEVHDHKIAFTSQLCHVIASALVVSAEDTKITEFGGGSFEDLTRIAMINAPLWTELFLSNKKELLFHIDSFEKAMNELRCDIENDNTEKLQKFLENVRTRRLEMV